MGVTAGVVLTDAAVGAAVGGGVAAVTGGDIGKGALYGGVTGGFTGGLGPVIGDATGLGVVASDALAGGVGGFVGGELTGQKPLESAIGGAASGALTGTLSPSSSAAPSAGGGGGGPVTGSAPIPDTVPTSDVLTPGGGVSSDLAPASSFPGASEPITSTDISAPGTAPPSVAAAQPSPAGPTSASPSSPTALPPGTQPLGAIGAPTAPSNVDTSFAGTNVPPAPPAGQSQAFTPTGETYNVSNATLQAATGDPLTPAASPVAPAEKSTGLLGEPGTLLNKVSSPTTLLSGAALGYEAIKGQQPLPNQGQLTSSANALTAQGQQLASYLASGTLPPGVQNSLHSAAESAKATIRSKYASMGISGSSSEASEIAAVDQNVATQGVTIAMNLLNQGVSEQNIGNQIYAQLMNGQIQQDNALAASISNFAVASAGGVPSLSKVA